MGARCSSPRGGVGCDVRMVFARVERLGREARGRGRRLKQRGDRDSSWSASLVDGRAAIASGLVRPVVSAFEDGMSGSLAGCPLDAAERTWCWASPPWARRHYTREGCPAGLVSWLFDVEIVKMPWAIVRCARSQCLVAGQQWLQRTGENPAHPQTRHRLPRQYCTFASDPPVDMWVIAVCSMARAHRSD